jgi:hypothetical protein
MRVELREGPGAAHLGMTDQDLRVRTYVPGTPVTDPERRIVRWPHLQAGARKQPGDAVALGHQRRSARWV